MSESLIYLILKEDFGEAAAHVAKVIHQNGEIGITEVVGYSKLPFNEVKHVLIVLIKHNIVTFFNKANPMNIEPAEAPKDLIEDFVYRLSVQDALYRLRFPKILQHIGTLYGNLCQALMEEFVENGRLTVSDILLEIEEHIKDGTIDNYSEREILEGLAALIQGQYLVHVQKSNYLSGLQEGNMTMTQTKPGVTGGRGSKKKAQTAAKEPSSKGRRTKRTKANPADEINMLAPNGLTKDIFARLGMIPGKDNIVVNEKNEIEVSKGQKATKEMNIEYVKTSSLFYDVATSEEYMFKINFRKLVHDFRVESILEVVRVRVNDQSSFVVQAILRDSQQFSRVGGNFRLSEPFTISEITQKLPSSLSWPEDTVSKYLQVLQLENFVKKVSNPDPKILLPSYCVEMESLISKIQIKTLEKIIEEKYSRNHARIFRILDNLGYLDEKQISDAGLMPVKQARACVMELITARIVDSQDIVIDGKASQVYGLRPQQAIANLTEEIHKVLFNLKKREEVEINKKINLMEMHADENDIEKTEILIRKLESAIIELDETLMLFCEF